MSVLYIYNLFRRDYDSIYDFNWSWEGRECDTYYSRRSIRTDIKYTIKEMLYIILSIILPIGNILKVIIDDIKTEFFWKEVIEIPDNKEIKYENTSVDIINVRSIDNTMVQK